MIYLNLDLTHSTVVLIGYSCISNPYSTRQYGKWSSVQLYIAFEVDGNANKLSTGILEIFGLK